jgi:hypothetical protein
MGSPVRMRDHRLAVLQECGMRFGRWIVQTRYGGVCCGLAGKRQSTARWRMRRDEQADALRRWQS